MVRDLSVSETGSVRTERDNMTKKDPDLSWGHRLAAYAAGGAAVALCPGAHAATIYVNPADITDLQTGNGTTSFDLDLDGDMANDIRAQAVVSGTSFVELDMVALGAGAVAYTTSGGSL